MKEPKTEQLLEVALRIREMREISGYTTEKMAEMTGVSEEQYISYESGENDLPFTFMHNCARVFGVELTALLEGRTPKLSSYTVNRKGHGTVTAKEPGILIQNMASMFRNKLATPYYVTYEYSEELQNQPIHTTTHGGQEFDLVLQGTLKVRIGDHTEILHEGDSVFYKSSTPHGMIAVDGKDCVFLAMIMAADESEQVTAVQRRAEPTTETPLLCSEFISTVEDDEHRLQSIEFVNTERFNFAFDIVDELGRKYPDKLAMLHISNDMTERRFTFQDIKENSAQAASYFTALGIKRGDRVMLVLKRHYQFWFAMLGLHKIGAVAIPATNQLLEHDFQYRFQTGGVKAVICTADGDTALQASLGRPPPAWSCCAS